MRFVLLLSSVVIASGCGLTDFDISETIPEQSVQGSPVPAPIAGLFPLPLSLDLSSKIKKQTTGPIDSVDLSSLTLAITPTSRPDGDVDLFTFIDEIHVFVKSSMDGTTLPRVEVASKTSPGEVAAFGFVLENVNLLPYVQEGAVIESEATGTLPEDDVSYDGRAVFTVHPL